MNTYVKTINIHNKAYILYLLYYIIIFMHVHYIY